LHGNVHKPVMLAGHQRTGIARRLWLPTSEHPVFAVVALHIQPYRQDSLLEQQASRTYRFDLHIL
jgi:hypothetical protein